MPLWLTNLGALCSLVFEILNILNRERARELVKNLTDAKTDAEKQAALNAISAELYKPTG